MRKVGQRELERFTEACTKVQEVSREAEQRAVRADEQYRALLADGDPEEASRFEATTIAELLALKNRLLARFEVAAVGFLGEKRGANETGDDYMERIAGMDLDLSVVLEIQRRNGIAFCP